MHLSNLSLAAVLTTAASFTVHPLNNLGVSVSRVTRKSSRSDQGWNNDNFLDALGGEEPARDAANKQYQRESANRAASRERRFQSMAGNGEDPGSAALFGASVPGMPDKAPKAPERDEENPTGGQMYKQMMEKAKQAPNRPNGAQDFAAEMPPATSPQAPTVAPPSDAMTYYQQQLQVWQEQMTVYAQLIATNPEAAAQMTMPPPPPPPPTSMDSQQPPPPSPTPVAQDPVSESISGDIDPKSYLPKGSGNKDSYEISGPADVYFAQLKRDSSIRSAARRNGDMDVANNPFADVGVKALTSILSDELINKRRDQVRETGGEFETSRDEMILPYADKEENLDITYSGVSYKQKLMEMKMKNKKGVQKEPQAVVASSAESAFDNAAPVVIPEPVPAAPVSKAEVMTVKSETPEEVETDEEGKPDFKLDVSDNFDDSSISAPSMEDSEDARKSIRTLMGLILKHRGGSGFGHGRLDEAESKKLTELVDVVMVLLKTEAGMDTLAPPSCPASSSAVSTDAPSVPEYATTMEFPDTYKVTKSEEDASVVMMDVSDKLEVIQAGEEEVAKCPMHIETDANTEIIQNIYDTLQSTARDEKYGLREIGSDEITHIKEVLKDMRSVLMEELDNGIPE